MAKTFTMVWGKDGKAKLKGHPSERLRELVARGAFDQGPLVMVKKSRKKAK